MKYVWAIITDAVLISIAAIAVFSAEPTSSIAQNVFVFWIVALFALRVFMSVIINLAALEPEVKDVLHSHDIGRAAWFVPWHYLTEFLYISMLVVFGHPVLAALRFLGLVYYEMSYAKLVRIKSEIDGEVK